MGFLIDFSEVRNNIDIGRNLKTQYGELTMNVEAPRDILEETADVLGIDQLVILIELAEKILGNSPEQVFWKVLGWMDQILQGELPREVKDFCSKALSDKKVASC